MQERSEETRARILRTAAGLFAQQGYDATGVAEICEAAEVSKGAFYHHYPTKQALFLELLDSWLAGLDRQFSSAREAAPSVPDALLNMARRTREIFEAADGGLQIFLEFWAQARKDRQVWQRSIAPFRTYRKLFASIIQSGIEEGSFRPMDADAAALALVSLAVGILLQAVVDAHGERWDQVMESAVRVFMDGMRRQS